jgi:DNA-binding NarL/FixJ family response regulator
MKNTPSLKITLIEDDLLLREMLHDFLKKKYPFASLLLFNTGEAALDSLYEEQHLVLLDYNLNSQNREGKNGIEILKQLKNKFPSMPVVFISGQDKPEIAISTMKYGAWDYIIKNDQVFNRLDITLNQIVGEVREGKTKETPTWIWGLIVLVVLGAIALFLLR